MLIYEVIGKLNSLPSMLECNPKLNSQSANLASQHYAKHANSMREVKPTKIGGGAYLMETGDTIRAKLISNSRAALENAALTGQDNSVNFVRPLKTSTAVCLANLKSRSGDSDDQKSNVNKLL